ncbi:MAG: S24 family peptidase [Pararhizobium sp.]
MEPKHRLQKARAGAGFGSPSDAARAFPRELNRNTLISHENGNRAISRDAAEKYGRLFGVSPGWILYGDDAALRDSFTPDIIPGSELVSNQTMPVYPAAMGGEGHIIVSFDEVDRVKRPMELENVKGGYGLLIVGDSMVPAYRPGDMALVHPHKPPARDTDVILYHVPPDNEAEAIVKRLIGFNDREWTLEQYNPYREFREFRKEWQVCHRVVGKYHAR